MRLIRFRLLISDAVWAEVEPVLRELTHAVDDPAVSRQHRVSKSLTLPACEFRIPLLRRGGRGPRARDSHPHGSGKKSSSMNHFCE